MVYRVGHPPSFKERLKVGWKKSEQTAVFY
jgi:hypothetical protein